MSAIPYPSMGVPLGFEIQSNTPLDPRGFVRTKADLNTYTGNRHIGRTVFVEDEGKEYQLVGGTTNAHWQPKGGESSSLTWLTG